MAAVAVAALAILLARPGGLDAGQAHILAAVLVTLGFWSTGAAPPYFASLVLFAAVLVPGLAPAEMVFAGFGSAAVWLIVSGFVIGSAIGTSGLGARLAGLLAPALGGSYPRMIGGLTLVAIGLAFVMPSSVGRSVVLVPIGMALAARAGFGPGSTGRAGVAVALAMACNLPGFTILPSNIPNMVLAGSAETILGLRPGYADYLLLHFPLGLLQSAVVVLLVLGLFPATVTPAAAPAPEAPDPRARAAQARVMAVLLATLGFWLTDGLHGVNPAWVGLVAAIVLMTPRVGVVTPADFRAGVDFGLLLFVAGALALGTLVQHSGLGAVLGRVLESVLPLAPGRDLANFLSLVGMSAVTGLFTTTPGAPPVLTPMAAGLSDLTGFSPGAVVMTQVVGFCLPIFAYQIAPLVVAMQLSGERVAHLARVLLPLAAVTFTVLVPLDFLWWRLLGWL